MTDVEAETGPTAPFAVERQQRILVEQIVDAGNDVEAACELDLRVELPS